jgi:transcriptional regulator with XRE-family HTH domain
MDLKLFKIKSNLTTKELSEALGIKPSYLSSIMSGYHIPSSSLIIRIINLTQGEVTAETFFRKIVDEWKKNKKATKMIVFDDFASEDSVEEDFDDSVEQPYMEE